jgi:hypothetical protein
MKTSRWNLLCLCTAASCLLALGPASQALADPFEFYFNQGPETLVLVVNDFQQFHSHLTNMGYNADSYTLNVVADQPSNWSFSVCYDGICYPPFQTSFTVPATGTLAPDETIDFDFDVTSVIDEGAATYTIEVVSNNDNSLVGTYTFNAFTPSESHGLVFARGEGVLGTTVNNFVQFHPLMYNAGLEPDSYTLTIARQIPENWTVSYCFDGICYPPTLVTSQIPDGGGTIPSAGVVPIDLDFTTIFDEGIGTVYVTIASNSDPTLTETRSFRVTTDSIVAVDDVPVPALTGVQATPNPFNPSTNIRFTTGGSTSQTAVIDIYNALGRRVRTLVAQDQAPGQHAVNWDGRDDRGASLAAGVYVASVRVGDAHQNVKMSLVK